MHCNCEDFLWSGKLIWRRRSDIGHSHQNIGLPVSATKKGQSSFKQQQRSEEKRRKRGIINLRAAAFNREVPGGMVGVKCSAGVRDNIGRQCQPFLMLCPPPTHGGPLPKNWSLNHPSVEFIDCTFFGTLLKTQ